MMIQKMRSSLHKLALTVPEPKIVAENTLVTAGAMAAVATVIFGMDTLFAFLLSLA